MARWFGFIDDPNSASGGTTLEDLAATPIPVPTTFVPVTSANADPGDNQQDRNDEVRGRRANEAPISFASAPSMTIEARAYPKLVRTLLRKALSGTVASTGAPPAAVSSTVGPIQSGHLQSIVGWLLREGQLDRMTGMVVNELEFNFPIDGEGTVSATMPALYHDVDDPAAADDPDDTAAEALPTATYPGYKHTFTLMRATAFQGDALVEVPNLAGFGFTFNNNNSDDFEDRFRPNHNIETVDVDGEEHDLWYPEWHRIGTQQVTGRIDLSTVDPDEEVRRIVAAAEKLVFEVAAGKLGTTPEAREMLRLTMYKKVLTGGGAAALQREGQQRASYEFGAYLDSGLAKDVEATFVGATALT